MATLRKIGWYDLLTRDHTVCRICFEQGDHAVRLIFDDAVIRARANPRTRIVWSNKMKTALRRHIAEQHPEWVERADWSHKWSTR